jgi:hypothetical protein
MVRISKLMLERYNLGEVTDEEKSIVSNALNENNGVSLAKQLEELKLSDAQIREKYFSKKADIIQAVSLIKKEPAKLFIKPFALVAAALLVFISLPLFINRFQFFYPEDRAKGNGLNAQNAIFNIYLKKNTENNASYVQLKDMSYVYNGDTIQLVYGIQGKYYGIIFSVDGRNVVTLHYPYTDTAEQGTALVSGTAIELDEAYTLDDAPYYEIFFFLISDKPVDTKNILLKAKKLAKDSSGNPDSAVKLGTSLFKNYEVKTISLLKENVK